MGVLLELRNQNGIKIADQQTLEEGRLITGLQVSSSRTIDSNIHAALNLANNSYYYDADWVRRIFEKAVYKANSSGEKRQLIEAAITIGEKSPKFSMKDVLLLLIFICKEKPDFVQAHAILSTSDNTEVALLTDDIKRIAAENIGLEDKDFL